MTHIMKRFALLMVLIVSMTTAQFYMYQPGTQATFEPWDQFGRMIACRFEIPSGQCQLYPYTDESLCRYIPDNVSVTPSISQTYRYGSATQSGGILVDCNVGNRGTNVSIAYTEDGTLPDIRKAVRSDTVVVRFNATRPTPIIIARCIDQGKLPSRIAYMQRMIWDDAVNGSYATTVCSLSHYKELNLPRCDPVIYGPLCDGQTIVNDSNPSTPTRTPSQRSPITTTTPSDDLSTPVQVLKSEADGFVYSVLFIAMMVIVIVFISLF